MTLQIEKILSGVEQLRCLDSELRLSGAKVHQYVFQPCLTEEEVRDYERTAKISLPEDYRSFLITVGNGGAGPYGGIKGIPDQFQRRSLTAPFKYEFATLDLSNYIAQIEALDQSDPDKFSEAYDSLTAQYWNEMTADGALYIADLGCNLRMFLVLNGPERGNIWHDATADLAGFSPVTLASRRKIRDFCEMGSDTDERIAFADWYHGWLDWSLRCANRLPKSS